MSYPVFLRPLNVEDAQISYQWRNDPRIWKFTGLKPSGIATPESEALLLGRALQNKDQERMAICLKNNDKYIGNLSFTNIKNNEAYLHLFIGETEFWGKGIGFNAVCEASEYGFNTLKLNAIYAHINQDHVASMSMFKNAGFTDTNEIDDSPEMQNVVKMVFTREMYEKKYVNS